MGILGVRFFFFSYLRYFELDEQIAPKSSRVILYTIPPDAPQLQASSPYGPCWTRFPAEVECLKEKEELTKPKEYRAKHAVFSRQAAIKSWEKGRVESPSRLAPSTPQSQSFVNKKGVLLLSPALERPDKESFYWEMCYMEVFFFFFLWLLTCWLMLRIRLWWFGLLLCRHFLDPRPTNIIILHAEWIAQVGGEEEGKSTMEGA